MRKLIISFFILHSSFFIAPLAHAAARPNPYRADPYANESEMPVLIRALIQARRANVANNVKTTQPRQTPPNPGASQGASYGPAWSWTDPAAPLTKFQYITYIKNGQSGGRGDCADRYDKYVAFFNHDSTLSGQISAKDGGPSAGRFDAVCDFLGYAHWCFALGFAYGLRDLDDPARASVNGSRCLTYQEFCATRNRAHDTTKTDDYLSRIIDEITFYQTSIKNTSKNTVATTTETKQGASLVTSTSWRVYDTDSWVREQITAQEMTRLLCR
ncbi:MAG: hypothetical protein LBQ49_02810 [Rickettsiales bacterium]|nr:hypothetical protein [Rickettsiales bacterium]